MTGGTYGFGIPPILGRQILDLNDPDAYQLGSYPAVSGKDLQGLG